MDPQSNYEDLPNARQCLSDKLCTFCSEESKSKKGLLENSNARKIPSEGPTAEALQDSDCPNCKEDRRIQNKDEKFVLHSKRDKGALQKRIVELEVELKRCKHEIPPDQENEELLDALLRRKEQKKTAFKILKHS